MKRIKQKGWRICWLLSAGLVGTVAGEPETCSPTHQEIPTPSILPGTLHSFQMDTGETRRGHVIGGKDHWIRIHVPPPGEYPPGEYPPGEYPPGDALRGYPIGRHSSELYPSGVQQSKAPLVTVLLKRKSVCQVTPLEWNIWDAAIAEGNQKKLECGWNAMNVLLGLPGARVGALGNALAQTLLEITHLALSDPIGPMPQPKAQRLTQRANLQDAQKLYAMIEKESSQPEERIAACAGRLRSWMAQGKSREALNEAEAWVRESSDPPFEAWDILGESLLVEVEKLVRKHPHWKQDRFVKPEVTQLLKECLDASFIPFVRQPIRENDAARGLLRAMRVYDILGNSKFSKQTALDIMTFYPRFREQAECKMKAFENRRNMDAQ